MKTLMTLACAVAIFCSAAQAQQKADEQAAMKAWMAYSTPGEMHKMLAKNEGTWKGDITMWMSPDAPPMKSTGTETRKMIMGGRYLETTSTGTFSGMPFEGHNIIGYDNAKKTFFHSWIDNMGTGVMNMEGTYDPTAKATTFRGKMVDPLTGKDSDVREVITHIDDDTEKYEMFTMMNGKEFKNMEMVSHRVK